MRQILFRGKRVDNGEWVCGDLSQHKSGKRFIKRLNASALCSYEVIPETLGQFTGLTEKNGNRIFEGDIVNIEYPETTVKNCIIEYVGASFVGSTHADTWELDGYYSLEVIGNIHDNGELLTAERIEDNEKI